MRLKARKKEDNSAFNWEILQKMKELNENGEYLDAVKGSAGYGQNVRLLARNSGIKKPDYKGEQEYFETQIDPLLKTVIII